LVVLGGGSSAAAAVWNVTKTSDSTDGACSTSLCSLRDAIVRANADTGDTINVPASASHYTLGGAVLEVTAPMTIIGAGARSTVIDASGKSRVLNVNQSGTVSISGVTITGGLNPEPSEPAGAGISVEPTGATVNLTDDAVIGNSENTGVLNTPLGGGIYNGAKMSITRTLIANNLATSTFPDSAFGGGILNGGTLTLIDSTVTGNTASGGNASRGGGIDNGPTADLTLRNVTLSGNSSISGEENAGGGNLATTSSGGGFTNLSNTIVSAGSATNNVGANCFDDSSNPPTSLGGNIDSLEQCGIGAAPGDKNNTDPKLTGLANHGGPTDTLALMPGSPAFRALTSCADSFDQRGQPRPVPCSIGAFEPQPPTIGASAAPSPALTGGPVMFTASPADADPTDALSVVTWKFDDGATASGDSVSHAFTTPGFHSGTAKVTDPFGFSATAVATVKVNAPAGVPLPGGGHTAVIASLTGLSESYATFAVAAAPTPLTATTATRRHHRGTVFTFTLDRAATVRIAITKLAPGRRVHGRCRPSSRASRHRPRCQATITLGTLMRAAHAGRNRVAFSGRIGSKALNPGRYAASFTAIDPAGASAPQPLSFTIVRR
jgi:CSLREA domain-containing protein